MAYNEKLADRTRAFISVTHKKVEEKKMFGGLCFMVNDKMCVGIKADHIMVRIDPEKYEKAMEEEGCKPMLHGGKTMIAFLFVDEAVLDTKKKLEYWLKLALEYNAIVPASKKKKK
jgi:TfoX/Sxy family transcriptional regulator of competence genes